MINDEDKSKKELIEELRALREKVASTGESGLCRDEIEDGFRTLSAVIDYSMASTIILDTDLVIEYVNQACADSTGYSAEELIGKHVKILRSDEHPPEFYDAIWDKARSGKVWRGEACTRHKNGEKIWELINISPIKAQGGEITRFVSIKVDNTDRRRAEEALRAEEEFTRTALDTQSDTFFVMEIATGKAVRWNKAFRDLTGYSDEEIASLKAPQSYYSEEDLKRAAVAIADVVEKGIASVELNLITKSGEIIPTEYIASLISDSDGNPKFLIAVGRDITGRKRAEEETLKAQKLESLSLLAAGIGHDFNNILTGILGNLSLMKHNVDSASPIYNNILESEKASLFASELTGQLLDFARGGAPVKELSSLGRLIKESCDFSLHGSDVTCDINLSADLPPVEIDRVQISQVLNNLIINAKQSMDQGGKVEVHAERAVVGEDSSVSLKPGYYVLLTLKDSGSGIAEEFLPKVFDPYFTSKKGGRGLGLATAYSIVKKHSGHIEVSSEVGVGTTFRVYLPASEKILPASEGDIGFVITGSGRVLVMDDEEMVRKVARGYLTHLGYDCEVARSGGEALDIYQKAMEASVPFDAVIMDVTVKGGMGGKEAIKQLLKLDPEARVIVSSGYSDAPLMANYSDYGFCGVVSKPYTVPKLSEVVYNVLSR